MKMVLLSQFSYSSWLKGLYGNQNIWIPVKEGKGHGTHDNCRWVCSSSYESRVYCKTFENRK